MFGPSTRAGRLMPEQHEQQARAKWTTTLTKVLVDLVVEKIEQRNGHKTLVGNKWKYICDEFFMRTGFRWDREQLKYRCSALKKLYAAAKSLLDRNDFSLDETTGAITATNEVWDQFIKEHPEADTLRSSVCPIYRQLCIMFSDTGGSEIHNNGVNEKGVGGHQVSNLKEECSTDSEEMAGAANEHDKPQCADTTTPVSRKRGRKGFEDTLADAILQMAAASRLRADAIEQCSQRYSVAKCINALDVLPGVDEKVYFTALDLFNNPIARETFLSLKVDKRLMWLEGKCKSSSSS